MFIVLALTGTVFFGRAIPGKNVSRDLIPYDLGVNVLQGLPRQAVILAEGDTYVLSLLHAQMTEGLRPDVAVVPTVFLNGDWGFRQAWAAIRLSLGQQNLEPEWIARPARAASRFSRHRNQGPQGAGRRAQ